MTATKSQQLQPCNGTTFSRAELLRASVELRYHALAYVKSMALRCAVKLGVADAINRRGGSASVEDLITELSLDASRLPCLRSVMRALAESGVFAEGGDMMEFIPPADAVLLKNILHDWSDPDCVNILKQCKEAIPARGKLIIIDIVLGSSPLAISNETQLWFDLLMSTITTGKERREKEWRRLFKEAGFNEYKIRPVLGLLSIIDH